MSENIKTQVEIERKYIIAKPDSALLIRMTGYTADRITQDYLLGEVGTTRRVRARESEGRVRYYETVKRKIDRMSSEESEREIDREEYETLLESRDPACSTINKVRHSFLYEGQLFEIDVYPGWEHTCVMETELDTRERVVSIPPFIKVIAEVTGKREYSNASMARCFPGELDS